MAMAMRSEFIKAVSELAAEVWDFHDRWAVHDRLPYSPAERMRVRRPLLQEEMRELDAELDTDDDGALAEEATDIAFVAIGHLAALEGLALESIRTVVSKNAAKSHATHYIDDSTGKITRRK
jgi:NTP pyrophosphatase (non-canonical NTP hydrolase)